MVADAAQGGVALLIRCRRRLYLMRSLFPILAAASLTVCSNMPLPAAATATAKVTLRAPGTGTVAKLTVTSGAFANGATMPEAEAFGGCGGGNISPDLAWTGAPPNTRSFVVTAFDSDAPTGVGFWHWLVFNIPSAVTSIAAGAGTGAASGTSGRNDYGRFGYGGPCPPSGDGLHHYHFTVSALDTVLSAMPASTTGAYLTFNMRGHIIAQGTYVGLYSR
jgi:Raf kinase inhibitor-like YbhB/YbcL family protein